MLVSNLDGQSTIEKGKGESYYSMLGDFSDVTEEPVENMIPDDGECTHLFELKLKSKYKISMQTVWISVKTKGMGQQGK